MEFQLLLSQRITLHNLSSPSRLHSEMAVDSTYSAREWPSIPHIVLEEPAHCKYKVRYVGMTKSMVAATTGDRSSRCKHCLRLELPLPLSLIPFSTSRCQWIRNDRASFWITDGSRPDLVTAERSGSARNAGCRAGYNAMHSVPNCDSPGGQYPTTACTQSGGWSNY